MLKLIVNQVEINIPEAKKKFFAHVSGFVLQVMTAAGDGRNPERLLSIGLHVANLAAIQANLKRKEFELLVCEGAVNLFFGEFEALRGDRYDPIAYLNLNFEPEINKFRIELSENYNIHVPKT